jgi:hypothetical protein
MKKRHLYALLFGLPGFFLAGIISLFVFGAATGTLWIFVFGDNPWPTLVNTVLSVLLVFVFLALWGLSMLAGYLVGLNLEADPVLNRNHILLSGGLSLLFLLCILIQQLSVGNLWPRSDTILCAEFCAGQGYAGSQLPPRDSGEQTCICLDNEGMEELEVPMEEIAP